MSDTEKRFDIKYIINIAIMLYFFFGFQFLPPIGIITEVGMQVLGVFIGLIWGWMFIDMLWPSILGIFAMGLTNFTDGGVLSILSVTLSNTDAMLVFLFLVFTKYLELCGLSTNIAYRLISMKALEGKPMRIAFMILFAAYVLGVFVGMYSIVFLMWAITYDILRMAGYDKGDRVTGFLLVGIVQMATLGHAIFPFRPFPMMCMGGLEKVTGITIGSNQFIVFCLTLTLLSFLAYFIIGITLIKKDLEKFKEVKTNDIIRNVNTTFTIEQKFAAALLLCFLITVLVPPFLNPENPFAVFCETIGTQGSLILMLMIACAVRINGKHVADFSKLINAGVNWSIYFLFLSTYLIGDALIDDKTNIMPQLSDTLGPLFSNMSGLLLIISSFVLLFIITQFTHNLILAAVFVPLLSQIGSSMGVPAAELIIIAIGLSLVLLQALMTPAASNRGAMIFGNEWIGKKNAAFFGGLATISAFLVILILGIPLGFLLF